ncbi:hypothetical protein F4809DRAFT_635015 [Biscogniauxia mediterranea]|nr:hypothetical protein F4809DRAFT_635015 [Biscogniauxia mediterranea]
MYPTSFYYAVCSSLASIPLWRLLAYCCSIVHTSTLLITNGISYICGREGGQPRCNPDPMEINCDQSTIWGHI